MPYPMSSPTSIRRFLELGSIVDEIFTKYWSSSVERPNCGYRFKLNMSRSIHWQISSVLNSIWALDRLACSGATKQFTLLKTLISTTFKYNQIVSESFTWNSFATNPVFVTQKFCNSSYKWWSTLFSKNVAGNLNQNF